MNENLKRHRPDIMALGEGKALAFMPEDPMGVWVHIQEVRDLLDVKDRTIRDYEDNYLPRPKTMSVKSWMIGSPETGEQWVYDAEEVDRVIAAKDKEIADLKTKADRLESKCLAKDGTIEELKASNRRLAKLVGKRSAKMLSFRKAMWKAISNWAKLEALRWLEREKTCPLGSDREGFCMKRRHLWERVGDKGAFEVADYETLQDNLLTKYADAIASGKGVVTAEQPMRIIGK